MSETCPSCQGWREGWDALIGERDELRGQVSKLQTAAVEERQRLTNALELLREARVVIVRVIELRDEWIALGPGCVPARPAARLSAAIEGQLEDEAREKAIDIICLDLVKQT